MKKFILFSTLLSFSFLSFSQSTDRSFRADYSKPGTVYRQTLPNGSTIYTDKPDRVLKIEKTIPPEPSLVMPSRQPRSNSFESGSVPTRPSSFNPTPGIPGSPLPEMPPLPGDSVSRPVSKPNSPAKVADSPASASKKALLEQLDDQISQAERALDNAVSLQKNGVAPVSGERSGTASGTSRLNESYQERQKLLSEAVVKAKDQLEQLQLKRGGM